MELENITAMQSVSYQKQEESFNSGHEGVATAAVASNVTVSSVEKVSQTEGSRDGEAGNGKQDKALEYSLEEVNKKLKPSKKRAEFSYNETIGSYAIKILDDETNEVIREVPSKDRLELSEKLMKMAGLILDEKG